MNTLSKTFIFLASLLLSVQSFSLENEYYVFEDEDEIDSQLDPTPDHLFTFTPKGGAELLHPNGDPTTVIKIYFDSEVVYVTDEGEYFDLTKENLLKMIEIRPHFRRSYDTDLATQSGPVDLSKVEFSNSGNKTTITINPPDTKAYYYAEWSLMAPHSITIKNFTSKDEVDNIVGDGGFSLREIIYTEFFVTYYPDSCSAFDATNAVEYNIDPYSQEMIINFTPKTPKADPKITYNIDIAFVISENHLNYHDLETWEQLLNERILPKVNKIYQNSGVNVRFNAKAVKAFSEYKNYLNCPVDLDGLSGDDGLHVLKELVPRIQNDTGADLIYGLHDYAYNNDSEWVFGISDTRQIRYDAHFSSRWSSVGSLDFNAVSRYVLKFWPQAEPQTSVEMEEFSSTLAHEIGHNLSLNHNYANYATGSSRNFTGYGYGGIDDDMFLYGTIMCDGNHIRLPFFSSNEVISKSDVCEDDVFEHLYLLYNFCDNVSESNDMLIGLGSYRSNSSDALQYTIKDASNYSELHRVNKQ